MDEEGLRKLTQNPFGCCIRRNHYPYRLPPLLALVGVEGKMFTPMAQTVSFHAFRSLYPFFYLCSYDVCFGVKAKKTVHKQNFPTG